jgi:hypothetical protein
MLFLICQPGLTEGAAMGIWIELGVFVLALAFGLWQIRDVKKAMAERERASSDPAVQAAEQKKDGGPD